MPKYRKKPVEIEARQVTDDLRNHTEIARWIESSGGSAGLPFLGSHITIDTLEGSMRAEIGDYVIRGVQGEFYPCKSDIFEATYERVADDERTDPVSEVRGDEAP